MTHMEHLYLYFTMKILSECMALPPLCQYHIGLCFTHFLLVVSLFHSKYFVLSLQEKLTV